MAHARARCDSGGRSRAPHGRDGPAEVLLRILPAARSGIPGQARLRRSLLHRRERRLEGLPHGRRRGGDRPAPLHPRPLDRVSRRDVDRRARLGPDHAVRNEGLGSLGRGAFARRAHGRIPERARGRAPRLHLQRPREAGVAGRGPRGVGAYASTGGDSGDLCLPLPAVWNLPRPDRARRSRRIAGDPAIPGAAPSSARSSRPHSRVARGLGAFRGPRGADHLRQRGAEDGERAPRGLVSPRRPRGNAGALPLGHGDLR